MGDTGVVCPAPITPGTAAVTIQRDIRQSRQRYQILRDHGNWYAASILGPPEGAQAIPGEGLTTGDGPAADRVDAGLDLLRGRLG